jgi:hypothetical protein
MACCVLPTVDKQLLHAQTWLHHRLTALAGNPHHQLLRQLGLWHQIPRLRARAARRPLTEAARRFAGAQFTQAERFLIWLDQRDRPPGAAAPRPTSTPGTPRPQTTTNAPCERS